MGQITIDTDRILHSAITILAIIGLVAVLIIGWGYITSRDSVVYATSAPTVTTLPVATISYPSVLTFTVLSTTTSNGRYQVTTTSGNILYFADYATWNSMYPQNSYTATLVGTDGVGYNVGTVVWESSPYGYYNNQQVDYTYYDNLHPTRYSGRPINYYTTDQYPTYWYYENSYYQCDRYTCDKVSHKQADGETLHYGRPPRPLSTGYYA
jgi:hypothetical protein